MNDIARKKSPRAPSMPLDEALERALRAYSRERLNPAPVDVIAQHVGYKSANNGAALSALASMRYFGLLERPEDGMLAVCKNVETYKFSADEETRQSLLVGFLKKPDLYTALLEKYSVSGLPSPAHLKSDLLQRGFIPASVDGISGAFVKSVKYARYFDLENAPETRHRELTSPEARAAMPPDHTDPALDRIPVRLSGGRKAFLIIPSPFFAEDKTLLKAQIDLILPDDRASEQGSLPAHTL